MPPVLTEAASPRSRPKKSEEENYIPTSKVLQTIEQHVLLDGFKVIVDLENVADVLNFRWAGSEISSEAESTGDCKNHSVLHVTTIDIDADITSVERVLARRTSPDAID